jgi:hypothetical protein
VSRRRTDCTRQLALALAAALMALVEALRKLIDAGYFN